MTYDNGIEMARHEKITKKAGMKIYFAHTYSSWERGTNENTNGLIRMYLPKGTDFNKIDERSLRIIQEKLNNRPRKIIGFKTPQEMMGSELKKIAWYQLKKSNVCCVTTLNPAIKRFLVRRNIFVKSA